MSICVCVCEGALELGSRVLKVLSRKFCAFSIMHSFWDEDVDFVACLIG